MIRDRFLHLNFFQKFVICVAAAVISVFIFNVPSFACTGVYVGSEANDQGTALIARSSDSVSNNLPSFLKVFGGQDGEKPDVFRSENGFEYYPKDVFYRFICAHNSDCCNGDKFFAFAINECGVSISSTVSGYCMPSSLKFNPIVKDGLCEDIMPAIVGSTVKTAREGIELLAKIIDEKGSYEDNILMISDQNECWYMEIYGGHQYCAVKAPNDCVACIGNEYAITTEYATCEDAICSSELFSLPAEKGFAAYNPDGKMNLFDTYVGRDMHTDFSHMRTWIGHKCMAPSTVGAYSKEMYLPLFYKPDSKISVGQAAEVLRNRYEGTEFCPETSNSDWTRVIATEEQTKTHILQTYKDAPADICALCWFCPESSEFGAFTPLCNCESKFDKSYTTNEENYYYDKNNICYPMKELNALCAQNREQVSSGVRQYLKALETYSMQIMPALIKENNKNKINDFCSFMQKQCHEDMIRLSDEVKWFYMEKTITMKNDVDQHNMEFIVRDTPMYSSTFDVLLFAKMVGWHIDDFAIKQKGKVNDPDKTDVENWVESGGKEAYVKISKNNDVIELRSTNGKVTSKGEIIINGKSEKAKPLLKDGKVYAPFELLNTLYGGNIDSFKDYTFLTSNNIKADKSPIDIISSWPTWLKIAGAIAVLLLVAIIVAIAIKIPQKKKE